MGPFDSGMNSKSARTPSSQARDVDAAVLQVLNFSDMHAGPGGFREKEHLYQGNFRFEAPGFKRKRVA